MWQLHDTKVTLDLNYFILSLRSHMYDYNSELTLIRGDWSRFSTAKSSYFCKT